MLALPEDPETLVDAIAFNVGETWLEGNGDRIELLYKLDVNFWRNRESLQLMVERILALE